MAKVASPGRCIYCPSADTLTNEHVVPEAFGGKLWIEAASCPQCQKITQDFERVVSRDMYWALRLALKVKGKKSHKRRRPTHWPVFDVDDPNTKLQITSDQLPRLYVVPRFPAPGILSGARPSPLNPEMSLELKGNRSDISRLLNELKAKTLEAEHLFAWGPFARMLAKICHAFAVSQVGLDGVEFFLPSIIRGTSSHLGHFVGCAPIEAVLAHPYDLGLRLTAHDRDLFLCAQTTILGPTRFPTYEAVVGRIVDPVAILRIATSNHLMNSRI